MEKPCKCQLQGLERPLVGKPGERACTTRTHTHVEVKQSFVFHRVSVSSHWIRKIE